MSAAVAAGAAIPGGAHSPEGVETRAELEMLRSVGVDKVQGYHLSKPLSLDDAARAAWAKVG